MILRNLITHGLVDLVQFSKNLVCVTVRLSYLPSNVCWYVLTNTDNHDILLIDKTTSYLYFQTKDLDRLRYFLEAKVAQSNNGIIISQRKITLDILK